MTVIHAYVIKNMTYNIDIDDNGDDNDDDNNNNNYYY
jgi:hypothetical protein